MSSFQSDERAAGSPTRVLITAGPTWEPIDRVRYLGNRSSGRMGIALADAAYRRGCAVHLLLGPVMTPAPVAPAPSGQIAPPSPDPNSLSRSSSGSRANQGPVPEHESAVNDRAPAESTETRRADGSNGTPTDSRWSLSRFQSTVDLERLLARTWPESDLLIMAAAVADYRPATAAEPAVSEKLPRRGEGLTLHLEATPDLVAACAAAPRGDRRIVGFALEPEASLADRAREKLVRKGLDAIVANPLETMDAETISAALHLKDGEPLVAPPGLAKSAFADWLLDQLAARGWVRPS